MFCSNYANDLLSQGLFVWCVAVHSAIIIMTCWFIAFEPMRNIVLRLHGLFRAKQGSPGSAIESAARPLAPYGGQADQLFGDALPVEHYRGGLDAESDDRQ